MTALRGEVYVARAPPVRGTARRDRDPEPYRLPTPLSVFDEAFQTLQAHPGVEQILLAGRDGLVIRQAGAPGPHADRIAAMLPGLAAAAGELGGAAGHGPMRTAVFDFDGGVAMVAPVGTEAVLAVLVRGGVGFAPLLRALRGERDRLATLF